MIDVLMSAAGSPGRTRAYTPSVSDSPLLAAHGGQKARIGAGVFLDDLQAAVIVQQPAEGLRRIGVLEVHADVLPMSPPRPNGISAPDTVAERSRAARK